MHADGRIRVAIVCPGAGRIRRGYEAEAIDLAGRLASNEQLSILLLQGGTPSASYGRRIPLLGRFGVIARLISHLTPLYATSVEHYSFGVTSLACLIRMRPDTLFVSERVLANFYGVMLNKVGLRTRIVFRNGGDHHPPFRHVDRVLHATEPLYELAAVTRGESAQHVYQPYLFDIAQQSTDPDQESVRDARESLGIEAGADVVISVGAIDRSRKRMDHLINEVGQLPTPRPFVIMLGQREEATRDIEQLAERVLGSDNYHIDSVQPETVATYLRISTVFALPSTREGFGRVYIEALDAGLRCLVHDSAQVRSVLGDYAQYVDMTVPGALTKELARALADPSTTDPRLQAERHKYAFDRYSWQEGLPTYLESMGLAAAIPNHAARHSPPPSPSLEFGA